jgi:shikimate kinase
MSETVSSAIPGASQEAEIKSALGARSVVLVGMMGAGKSTIGRRLSARLGLPFLDADGEIEAAAGMSIPDIFESRGELDFRNGEVRVIARLLDNGPAVLATGGGAFMRQETRDHIHNKAVSIWLKVDSDVILRRVRPSAASDRRPRGHRGTADQRTRAGLSAGRSDGVVARRAAREDRR